MASLNNQYQSTCKVYQASRYSWDIQWFNSHLTDGVTASVRSDVQMYAKGVSNHARIQALKDELCQVLLQHFKILLPPLVQKITVLLLVKEMAESALTSAVVHSLAWLVLKCQRRWRLAQSQAVNQSRWGTWATPSSVLWKRSSLTESGK